MFDGCLPSSLPCSPLQPSSPGGRRVHRLKSGLTSLCFVFVASFAVAGDVAKPKSSKPTGGRSAASEPTAEGVAFFEAKIRPVLLEHCVECHSSEADSPDGGLALDRAAGWRVGGESGPAIAPGDSEESLLMAAIRYESLEMPPDRKLPADVIADFERWIQMGAPDPREEDMPQGVRQGQIDWDAAREFWAFQPPRQSEPPEVQQSDGAGNLIDRYLLAKLEVAGLKPAPDADPLVRLRRLAFDLTGLPPSPERIEAFRNDPSDAHWRRIVDELLHSPEYAEHWGRHWLDVARYADSNGSDFNATFHDAWRYRDFVIRSFADDKPFDRFVIQQIAGDLLEDESPEAVAENLIATGFLMLGTKMLSERDKDKLEMDVVDDMIDTVGRAFLGLTLGCARCHDHKFDPIPTEDYYALAGIFRSTQVLDGESQRYVSTWHKRPLPVEPQHAQAVTAYETEKKQLASQLAAAKKELESAKKLVPLPWGGLVIDDSQARREGQWQQTTFSTPYHGEGYVHDNNRNKGEARIVFAGPAEPGRYEVRICYTAGGNRASNVPVELHLGNGETRSLVVNQRKTPAIEGFWHSLGSHDFADVDAASLVIRNDGTDGYVLADAVQYLKAGEEAFASQSQDTEQSDVIARVERAVKQAEQAVADLEANQPAPLPLAMAVRDAAKVGDTFVCVRGEVANRGPDVPRGFLKICSSGEPAEIPEDQSGRLQLASWITDPDNPLTARVMVNRVWMHLYGEGLVRTVDNFGVQGEAPSHRELLDRLAIEFVRDGWSIRRLVRRLVMTRAYSRSSRNDEVAFEIDPDNRLLWRASRRRLPAEARRDTLLIAAGQLDPTPSLAPMAGFGTLVTQNVATPTEVKLDATPRRSLYLPVIRGQLPTLLVTFDFADPDLIVGRRESTNVPSQGLAMLNNPEVSQWCEQIAQRLIAAEAVPQARLRAAYHQLLQRDPNQQEQQWLLEFIVSVPHEIQGWTKAVQTLAASTEFRFLD